MFNKENVEKLIKKLSYNETLYFLLKGEKDYRFYDREKRNNLNQIIGTVCHIYDLKFDNDLIRIVENVKENWEAGNATEHYIPYSNILSISIKPVEVYSNM